MINIYAVFVLIGWFELVGLYKSKVRFWILILVENYHVESMGLKLGFDYGFYIYLGVTLLLLLGIDLKWISQWGKDIVLADNNVE